MQKNNREKQRIEWLGDSVLNFVVSKFLFEKHRLYNEGQLTDIRKKLVSTDVLKLATERLSKDTSLTGLSNKQKADMFEVLVGEEFSKGEIDSARKFVMVNLIAPFLDMVINDMVDYKTTLQEYLQKNGSIKIEYKAKNTSQNMFNCDIIVNGVIISSGVGTNKKEAEKDAARRYVRSRDDI